MGFANSHTPEYNMITYVKHLALLSAFFSVPLAGHDIFITNESRVTIECLRGCDHPSVNLSCMIKPGETIGVEEELSLSHYILQWWRVTSGSKFTHATTFNLCPLTASLHIIYRDWYPFRMIEVNSQGINGFVTVEEKTTADDKILKWQYCYVPKLLPLETKTKA